ncbi:MAG: hypothetical protein ACT4NL_14065 [Pseudomarimonas sp.]
MARRRAMPGGAMGSGSLEEQRLKNGGYTDAEIDAALLVSQRSDPISVAVKLGTLALVYALLACAIMGGMTAPYLVLPLIVEFLAMFWIGWIMVRTVVPCPAFRRSAGGLLTVIIWTAVVGGAIVGWLIHDARAGLPPDASGELIRATMLSKLLGHSLHWAIVAALIGLLVSTALEISAWRRRGSGVFVWTAIAHTGVRIGLVFVGGLFVVLVGAIFKKPLVALLADSDWGPLLSQGNFAWPIWALLLLLDLGAVAVLALMHRDLKRKAAVAR